jgi:hypothetical protein
VIFVVVGLVVAASGVGVWRLRTTEPEPPAKVEPAPPVKVDSTPAASPPAAVPTPATPTPAPIGAGAPGGGTVLVDSVPPGAAILRDGAHVSETPEEIPVPAGGSVHLVLHQEGYRDAEVTIDLMHGRKVVVPLSPARPGEKHAHAAVPAGLGRHKPVVPGVRPSPAARGSNPKDPYERLDKGDGPLDPYR